MKHKAHVEMEFALQIAKTGVELITETETALLKSQKTGRLMRALAEMRLKFMAIQDCAEDGISALSQGEGK